MQCVILAGGLATRLRPITETIPKAMVEVLGRPFCELQLEWLAAQGVDDVVFCIGYRGEQLREHVGDGQRFGVRTRYVDEGAELKGTAGALRMALDAGVLEPAFGMLYGDSYLTFDMPDVFAAFAASGAPALMTAFRNEGLGDTSNAQLLDGRVVRFDKGAADPAGEGLHWIDYGFSVFTRDVIAELVAPGAVADLAGVQTTLSNQGRLAAYEVADRFYEIGSPQGLADLEAHLQSTGRAT